MPDSPKVVKRLVREWAAIAHYRELGHALLELRTHFDRWDRGEIGPADLNDLIHQSHQGASRDIWNRYATNQLEPAIGYAVAAGILRREELPEMLVRHVQGLIALFEADGSGS